MRKVAIFMSDFHLGQKDRMEEFHADEEFAELLGRLSSKHANDQVDLVLLGDVMDLWTTITDPNEITAQTADQVNVYFPVTAQDARAFNDAVTQELAKVEAIINAHPLFFEALGRFLMTAHARRRVVYVPGNHDHSVVEQTTIQPAIRQAILTNAVIRNSQTVTRDDLESRIEFRPYYEDSYLHVYAEHGNQLTYGGAFKYDNFSTFGSECPGYYELKLVWNRLERRHPEIDNVFMEALTPATWPGLFWWLLFQGHIRAFYLLRTLRVQYDYSVSPGVQWARRAMPAPWKAALRLITSSRFGVTQDEFSAKVLELFDQRGSQRPLRGEPLQQGETKTLILGHSHHTRDVDLPNGVKYYNLGSWIFRCQNGRRTLEQTWVTISREIVQASTQTPAEGDDSSRKVIDREMTRRKVELARTTSSPVTQDGGKLNAVLREMHDLRVGDVVLFHWNFGATLWRLLKSGHAMECIRVIPGMVISWFNRYGSSSYWNHAALVYASPSEKEEAAAYLDPLFIEANPDSGVAIHGPQHYVADGKTWDWNFAVLRAKAPWLNDPHNPDLHWDRRRLLRRIALSALQTHYNTTQIVAMTLAYAAKTMDARNRALVSGLFKGAIAGVVISALWLLYICFSWLRDWTIQNGGMVGAWAATTAWVDARSDALTAWLDQSGIIPFIDTWVTWLEERHWSSNLLAWGFKIALGLIVLRILYVLLLALRNLWLYMSALYGAAVGALIVPLMAELADGWESLSNLTRWLTALVWISIPVSALLATWSSAPHLQQSDQLSVPLAIESLVALVLLEAVAVIWILSPLVSFLAPMFEQLWTRAKSALPWTMPSLSKAPLKQSLERQFVCSSLVQFAYGRTAEELGQDLHDVKANPSWPPTWEDTLPTHFAAAAADRFEWVYLYIDGILIHRPPLSYRAQVGIESVESTPMHLNTMAAWCFRLALLALCLVILSDLGHKGDYIGWPLLFTDGRIWNAVFLLGLAGGGLSLWCAHLAQRALAQNPVGVRGVWLTNCGSILGYATLIAPALFYKTTWTEMAGSSHSVALLNVTMADSLPLSLVTAMILVLVFRR